MDLILQINRMTNARALLLGLSLAGFYYWMVFDHGEIQIAQIQTNLSQIETLRKEIRAQEVASEQARRYQELVNSMGGSFDTLVRYLPEKMSVSDLMRAITSEAKAAGASINRVADVPSAQSLQGQFYDSLRVEVELNGTFHSHLLFLSFLTRLEQILMVEKVSMRSGETTEPGISPPVTMVATIVGYRYVPEASADQKVAK